MRTLLIVLFAVFALPLQAAGQHYALVLEDPPVAQLFHSPQELRSEAAKEYRNRIEKAQQALRAELVRRHIRVTGDTQVLSNCVFVSAPPESEAQLRNLNGVKSVVPLSRRFRTR
jgi:hypothetical protein